MTDDRIAQLERMVAQMDAELQATRRRQAAVEAGSAPATRQVWLLLATAVIALMAAGFLGVRGLTTATAAPNVQTLTVKALHVVGSNGAEAWLRGDSLVFYAGKHLAAGLGGVSGLGGQLRVYNSSGEAVGILQAGTSGAGRLAVEGHGTEATLGEKTATPANPQGGQGEGSGGNSAPSQGNGQVVLRIFKGGNLVSGIGAGENGGVVQINDVKGAPMANMSVAGTTGGLLIYAGALDQTRVAISGNANTGSGAIDIRNTGGQNVAEMTGRKDGGYLALANSAGNAMVEAGVLPGGVGAVRVYPQGGLNWYIKGKGYASATWLVVAGRPDVGNYRGTDLAPGDVPRGIRLITAS